MTRAGRTTLVCDPRSRPTSVGPLRPCQPTRCRQTTSLAVWRWPGGHGTDRSDLAVGYRARRDLQPSGSAAQQSGRACQRVITVWSRDLHAGKRPATAEPGDDGTVQVNISGGVVGANPGTHVGVSVPRIAVPGRINVHATDHLVVGVEHGIREAGAIGEVSFVLPEVGPVSIERVVLDRPRAPGEARSGRECARCCRATPRNRRHCRGRSGVAGGTRSNRAGAGPRNRLAQTACPMLRAQGPTRARWALTQCALAKRRISPYRSGPEVQHGMSILRGHRGTLHERTPTGALRRGCDRRGVWSVSRRWATTDGRRTCRP